ncbi:MAG: PAS domain S-box protein [Gemmataceae bacterium]|nr:PAS domain S-box protein [Gemmataceae bacterium]
MLNESDERTATPIGMWVLAIVGVATFHCCWLWQGDSRGLWLPGLGVGVVLVSWFGWRILPVLLVDLLLARWPFDLSANAGLIATEILCQGTLIGSSWWLYHHLAHGSRWLDDPRSAMIFLILIPGGLCVAVAGIEAGVWCLIGDSPRPFVLLTAELWLTQIVGIVATVPILIATATLLLLRRGLIVGELSDAIPNLPEAGLSRIGESIELIGLTAAVVGLSLLHLWTTAQASSASWLLWASGVILLVWICIRQGLFGGTFAAGVTAIVSAGTFHFLSDETRPLLQSDFQGRLLALCATAMLVGVSASWIRANETRFSQIVSRIPFVVYSVRLPYGIPTLFGPDNEGPPRDSKFDMKLGPAIRKLANVVLVSPACESVLGAKAESLVGPFSRWMDHILPEDHVIVVAALAQLCLQKKPVKCEYRLVMEMPSPKAAATALPIQAPLPPAPTWVRDTLTPHYDEAGMIDGWEGLVEDITEQRALSQDIRRMTTMLQVIIANLPTGVYFVQAPRGLPILVNARARVLLGQREDLAAGLSHLPRVYRLHKPDGTAYPWEGLPVARALQSGVTCKANDIVVHRPDGRKIPLITWAAPVDLYGRGKPDAAVWVLEDWSAIQQAETAMRESEMRLRAIIETMAEGVILQDATGIIVDCNPAACAILGAACELLMTRTSLAPDDGCVQENGEPLPADQHPDRLALRTEKPVREAVIGMPAIGVEPRRWLLVNSLPIIDKARKGPGKTRVISTFADITTQVRMRDSLRQARDKYQNLIESLPVVVMQRDRAFNITFVNPFTETLTGYTVAEMLQPGSSRDIIYPEDLPDFLASADLILAGQPVRKEIRMHARDGSTKTVLVFIHPIVEGAEIVGSTSLMLDLTVQRRLEKELESSRQLELVGRLASGTVHDFNNLLAVIIGMAGLVKMNLPENTASREYLTRIEEVGEQASHLAGQLLTFSKQTPREAHPVDLNAVILQTMKLAKSICPASIRLTQKLTDSLPAVHGEEGKLKQVILNLCLNARDAMKQVGGTLTIRTDLTPPSIVIGETTRWVHFAIEDTGHGMDETVRRRIFEPFFSTKEHGTGLGLAVVHRIIHDFGGRIDVQSQIGVGTRFDIWLAQADVR